MVQFVAFGGALLFGSLARRIGAKRAILAQPGDLDGDGGLCLWRFCRTELQFFIMGGVIAIVLGGSQALSRSLFSQMIPLVRSRSTLACTR